MIKFTKEENIFINRCFEITLIHFVKNPKKRDDIDDIREVVNYRNYRVGSIGVPNHKLMHSIFGKMGYCNNGKTTLEEEEKRLESIKIIEKNKWIKDRNEMLELIDSNIGQLNKKKIEILNHDKNFNKIVKAKTIVAQEAFSKQMNDERDKSRDKLVEETQKTISELSYPELRKIAKEKKIPDFHKMKTAELQSVIGEGN